MDGRKILINLSGTPSRPIAFKPIRLMAIKTSREFTLEKTKEQTGGTKLPVDR
jgi:hypothetical protein